MSRRLGRRLLLQGASVLPFAAPALAADRSITVMIWGTTWQLVMHDIADAFTKASGIGVQLVTQTTSGEALVKLQAMKANPTVDVWFTTSSVAERAVLDDTMFVDLPSASMKNWSEVMASARHPRWVGAYAYPLGIIWRPDMVSAPITKWEDLWDKRFANKIGLPAPSSYQARTILIANILAGGTIDNIEPGLQKLKALKDNVAFWYTSDAQARKALAQGDIAVLVAGPSAAKSVRDQGAAVDMICPKPAPELFDVMTLLKTPKQELGAQFIDFVLSKASQTMIGNQMQNQPVNTLAAVPELVRKELPKPEDEVSFDESIINKNIDSWTQRFNQIVTG